MSSPSIVKNNKALRDFWRSPKPYKRLKGGRFSGKTQDAAGMAVTISRVCKKKFLCIRQFQNRISQSVYSVLVQKIEEEGIRNEYVITNSSITHLKTGSQFIFYGIARNIADIKGTEGVDICWIEEAEGLTEEQWNYIDPTIRREGSQIWMIWNPRLQSDFIEKKLPEILGDDCITAHINYDQNPFLPKTARDKAERLKKADPESYEHIYLGIPLADDDLVVIKRSWILAAIDAHKELGIDMSGVRTIGFDVADDGGDMNALTYIDGYICKDVEEWKGGEDELFESTERVLRYAKQNSVVHIGYDSIGVGAGTGSNLNKLGFKRHFRFNAGGKVSKPEKKYKETGITNQDYFSGIKSQTWWAIADRFRNTYNAVRKGKKFEVDDLISICGDMDKKKLDKLIDELSTPRREFDNMGRVKVESKKDLAKRDIKSPNIADSFIIAYSKGMLARKTAKELN